jgi:hypothetical protein
MEQFIVKFVEISRAFLKIAEGDNSLGLLSGLANELEELSKRLKQHIIEQYAIQEDASSKVKTINIDL